MILCRNLQPVRCSAAKRCNTGSFISFMAGGSDKRHVVVHEADDAVMILRIPIARPARLHDLQPRQRNLHRFHPPVRDAGREDERIALVVIPLDAVVHSLALLDKFLNALQQPNFDLSVRKSDAEVLAFGLPVLFLVFEVFRTPACDLLLGLDAGQKRMAAVVRLPEIRRILATDVEAAYYGDPAATCFGEIICCYPVIRAVTNYRIAHELHRLNVPLIPRIITEMAHSETGIDIHPGAQIGHHFTIDHGTGVVIGATCIIGNHVKLYQGVTLGAKSFPCDEQGNPIKGIPRHPILEDNVIVYSNATILGRITIGEGATIGGNIWVTESVPAGARIVQRKSKEN